MLPCLDALADDREVPDCLFLGAIPQYDARWSRSGKSEMSTEMTSSDAVRGADAGDGEQAGAGGPVGEQGRDLGVEPGGLPRRLRYPPGSSLSVVWASGARAGNTPRALCGAGALGRARAPDRRSESDMSTS